MLRNTNSNVKKGGAKGDHASTSHKLLGLGEPIVIGLAIGLLIGIFSSLRGGGPGLTSGVLSSLSKTNFIPTIQVQWRSLSDEEGRTEKTKTSNSNSVNANIKNSNKQLVSAKDNVCTFGGPGFCRGESEVLCHYADATCTASWESDKQLSRFPTVAELMDPESQEIITEGLKEKLMQVNRKEWEYVFIIQAAKPYIARPDSKILGFAVGQEPLPAYFAAQGAGKVIATDLEFAGRWSANNEHIGHGENLNNRGIATKEQAKNMRSEFIDMNKIADEKETPLWKQRGTFDMIWSTCAIEHLDNEGRGQGIPRGLRFIVNSAQFLKPGGISVHTLEFNIKSLERMAQIPAESLFRQKDVEAARKCLIKLGYEFDPICYDTGKMAVDYIVDGRTSTDGNFRKMRCNQNGPGSECYLHMKLFIQNHASTSLGFVIRRPENLTGEIPVINDVYTCS